MYNIGQYLFLFQLTKIVIFSYCIYSSNLKILTLPRLPVIMSTNVGVHAACQAVMIITHQPFMTEGLKVDLCSFLETLRIYMVIFFFFTISDIKHLLLWVMSQILMQNFLFTVYQIGFLPSMLIIINVNSN